MIDFFDKSKDKFDNIYDIFNYCTSNNLNIKEYLEGILGGFIFGLCIDETEDLLLINCKKILENIDFNNKFYNTLSTSPSIILDKKTKKVLIEYYNNTDKHDNIQKYDWTNTHITYIYPGINLTLFYHNNNWILATEIFLENNLIDGYGYLDYIKEKLFKKLDVSNLCKDYYYNFIFQNNKNKNFVDNFLQNNSYEEFIFSGCNKLGTFELVDYNITGIDNMQILHFSCLDELLIKIDFISYENKINKTLSYAGFNIKIYDKNKQINNFNFYTEIYNYIKTQIIEGDNIYKIYLELYQKNFMNDILPYISKYPNEIISRLNMSMKTLSREILNIYHITRKKKHQELYKLLPELYKKILYGLHGLFINTRNKDLVNRFSQEYDETKSITVHDVYYYIKELTTYQLIELFKDRMELLKNPNFNNIMNHDCIYILTQTKLMLKDDK